MFPFTIFLAVVSLMVAALSRIGEDDAKVGFLFFAEPLTEAQHLDRLQKMVIERAQQLHGKLETADPEAVAEAILNTSRPDEAFFADFRRYGVFDDIKKGEVWRLFTPIFLHFGLMHIVFNMLGLWQLGQVLETGMRTARFSLLVLLIALVSNVTQALASGPGFGGMSGVVYGLFGYMMIRSKYHPAGGPRLNQQYTVMMLIWLVLGFTGSVGPIANGAHLAGLLTGGVMGFASALHGGAWGQIKRRREFRTSVAATKEESLHRCAVCGKTERDDAALDFRISSDGEEYCEHHLPPP